MRHNPNLPQHRGVASGGSLRAGAKSPKNGGRPDGAVSASASGFLSAFYTRHLAGLAGKETA